MKYVQGITSRGMIKNDIRCALVMSPAARELREYLQGQDIRYATFEYDMLPKTVPAIERRWPGDAMPVDEAQFKGPVPADYWNPYAYNVTVGRSHAHVCAKRGGRLTYGTAALRAAAQARASELLWQRADQRLSEWLALQGAISNSQAVA